MDSSQDLKSIQETIQNALVATTRRTNQIAAEDLSFQRTSNPDVAERLDDSASQLLSLATSLIASASKDTNLKAPELEDEDDIDVHWTRIVDVVDTLLEKADTCLDEYTGMIKRKAAPTEQSGPPAKKPKSVTLDPFMRNANIIKPQNAFDVKTNNLATSPWKPILTKKPHAVVPLKRSLTTFQDEDQTIQYKHPYETEITQLQFPKAVFEKKEPTKYQPVETTSATFVNTFEGVLEMLEELKGATEIAIDTEHHDFRTYAGLLSLMQISTREKDWIVDTLQPWRRKLEVLNEVFADPKIVKVLHGAYMDIIWLQRDCGLYIVGLFDTFEAASALQYPTRSLAYLLKRFVDFDADKKYQLADWRIRPIPEEMFYYARSDTHYLLYIYDMMRNELLDQSGEEPTQNLVHQVLDRSKATSLRRYETSKYDAEGGSGPFGWYNLLLKHSSGKLSKEQFAVYRALHKWRDEVARREDESALYIMNNSTLFDITRQMPPDPKALHSLVGTTSHVAKRDVFNLFNIISKAKADGANGPSVHEVIRRQNQSTIGVGEVAKSVFPQLARANKEGLEVKDLVSHSSKLWGDIPISSRWEKPSKVAATRTMQFELPWAQYLKSSKVSEDTEAQLQQSTVQETESYIPITEAEKPVAVIDDEFTLKAGLKRKVAKEESESEPGPEEVDDVPSKPEPDSRTSADDEEIALPDSEDEKEDAKKARRREKRSQKKARKQALKQQVQETKALAKRAKKEGFAETAESMANGDEEEKPFDYSKAKSVLKAARTTQGASSKAPRFNPYGMTAEGPKPARKMHGEKPGKSATFKK
ncbi:ribonuclease H-like domain-containing protein [Hypoxylon sp. FL1150]|nr:ribonuclease H-like domain-containing protein [Hypoxylon sp. FL1150]